MNVAFRLILLFLFLSVTGQAWGISVTQHQYNSEDIAFGADEYVYNATINLLVCCDNQSVEPQSHDARDRYSLALIGDFDVTKGAGGDLFRVVDDIELADIKKTGAFRTTPGQFEGKQFVDNRGDAQKLQKRFSDFFGGNQTIVKGRAPQSVLDNASRTPFSDIPNGTAITVPKSGLPAIKPKF